MTSEGRDRPLRVLYLCVFLDAALGKHYDYAYAQAGLNKKRGIVRSLAEVGIEHLVVSPLFLNGWSLQWYRQKELNDTVTGAPVIFPATIRSLPPFNLLFTLFTTIMLVRRAHRENPFDAVIFYNWTPQIALSAILCRLLFGIPVVLEYEDGLFAVSHRRPVARAATLIEGAFVGLLDGAIINTLNFQDRIETQNVAVVRGVVDGGVPPAPTPTTEGPLVVLFAGTIDEVRGASAFLAACEQLANDPALEIWITGHGTRENVEALEMCLEELNASNVQYLGFLPYGDYRERLDRADVVVSLQDPGHPFSQYSFPSKLIEFMAEGKTIVATPVSDVASIAKGRLILCNGEPDDIAQRIREVAKDPERFGSYGDRARAWVDETCTPAQVGQRLRTLLENAADGRRQAEQRHTGG